MTIKRVKRVNLRNQCLDGLRHEILSGQLAPGERLIETELSEAFEVSRGTLREAMRHLEQEGLLIASDRGQLSVRSIDRKEIRDIYRIRAALETLAARMLCEQPNVDDSIARLRAQIECMRDQADDFVIRIESDLDFHRLLCQFSGSDALGRSWRGLEGPIRMSIVHAGTERALLNMAPDRHADIVDAITTRDGAHIAAVLDRHMTEAADRVIQALDAAADDALSDAG